MIRINEHRSRFELTLVTVIAGVVYRLSGTARTVLRYKQLMQMIVLNMTHVALSASGGGGPVSDTLARTACRSHDQQELEGRGVPNEADTMAVCQPQPENTQRRGTTVIGFR